MLNSLKAVTLVAVMAAAVPADARPVNVEIAMNSYSGQKAYLAAYIVDPNGQYVSTVATSGTKSKYLKDLGRWNRMFQRAGARVDGTTGASIGSGQILIATVDVPDAMLNAGYTLRVETAVEDQRYLPDDAAVAMSDASKKTAVAGTGYVRSLKISY